MTANTRIATCCYCGTRAALVLKGEVRHELACASCGAPLHEMKMLRADPARPQGRAASQAPRPASDSRLRGPKPKRPVKRPKRRKSLASRLLDEVFDVIDDVFD